MAEGQTRSRRAAKYAETPDRVSSAAQQMSQQQQMQQQLQQMLQQQAQPQTRPQQAQRQPQQTQKPQPQRQQPMQQQPQARQQTGPQMPQQQQQMQQPYYGVPSGQMPQGYGMQGNGMNPQEAAWMQQQQLQQQQYYEQQQAMQQEYARQMAWQQEQQRQHHQRVEKERLTSETSSHGALRGYTGQNPVLGGQPAQQVQPPKQKSHIGLILVIVILVGMLGTGGYYALQSYQHTKEIHDTVTAYDNLFVDGVYVDGLSLGGMTPEQGMNTVQSQIQERNNAWHVTLMYQGTQLAQINAGMLGMSVDIGQVLNDAWAQGHTGDEETRYAAMQDLQTNHYEAFTATPSGDTSVIDNVLAQVKSQIDTPAVNARLLTFDPSQAYPFTFQEESKGKRLNTDELRDELYHMVATMTSGNVELEPETIEPNVYLADLQKHYMLRSSVYTPISTSSEENRNNNIRRAFEFLNGYVLQPGTQFSFNNVVGERTEANGFFPAIEYAYGEHVMGIGGGVCQASTTVYQAAVCAGLQILKRSPHSDSVSYTEYGKDATVYWLYKRKIDLVFKNNTEDPIYFVAAVQQDPSNKKRLIAKVSMYGADMGDVRYEIECKTVQEIDPPETPTYIKDKDATYVTYTDQQKSVSKAKPGYVVESYRVKYEGNVETERVLLFSDTYEPKSEKVYVGVTRRGE